MFYPHEQTASVIDGVWMDAVYSHGCWSYVGNFRYTSRLHENRSDGYEAFEQDLGIRLLACLTHCTMERYPYTVYFDRECIYFMSKNQAFPNDYLDLFNEREDMHLLSGYPVFEGFSSSFLSTPFNSAKVEEIPDDVNPLGGSYDPNRSFKESEPVDLASVGLDWDFQKEYHSVSSGHFGPDPFNHKSPSEAYLCLGFENPDVIMEECASPKALFDEDAYYYIPHTALSVDYATGMNGSVWPGFMLWEPVPQVYPPKLSVGQAWVDAVYSHGRWSYIANCNYNPFDQSVKGNLEAIFAALFPPEGKKLVDPFHFDVYFDDHCLYFMHVDKAFPNDYIEEFNKREDMHLIYSYPYKDSNIVFE